jgi:multidrug resistance efflux pump
VAAASAASLLYFAGGGPEVAPAMAEKRKASLAALRDARVASIDIKRGDRVKAVQVLVRLDPSEIDAELAVARAELERLTLEIDSRSALLGDERLATADRLSSQAERASLELARLEADQKRDRSELEQVDEQIERERKLVDEKISSAETLNRLLLLRSALSKKVSESEATLREAKAHRDAAARRLEEWQKSGPVTPVSDPRLSTLIAPRQAAVTVQRERCRRLELQRDTLELKAPFDGQVSEIAIFPGEVARSGQPIVTLVAERPTMAIAYLDQAWALKVRPGDEVTLVSPDRTGPVRKGRVASLGPDIVELPERFRPLPDRPAFAREVHVELDPSAEPPLPGQAFAASFRSGKSASP